MFQERFVDFDELLLLCKERQTRGYIAEAIACYQAGAYRATIVNTWIAVVFDFIHKLRDLALAGDAAAQAELDKLANWQRAGDWKQANNFENRVLIMAKDTFEFLSVSEYEDLHRLYEDRNRCAHPSMLNPDEPYQATAELARYHLRNAVTHLLQHPPVQGKAAMERILTQIESDYFPIDVVEAKERFQHSPMARARTSLVRNVIVQLTKALLLEDHANMERGRYFAALNAVVEMYPAEAEFLLRESLPKIIEGVKDAQWLNVIKYLRSVPLGWETLNRAYQAKARDFVASCSLQDFPFLIFYALSVLPLRELVIQRIPQLTNEELIEHIRKGEPSPLYIDNAIWRFIRASSYKIGTQVISSMLLPLSSHMTAEHVKQITKAYLENRQLYDSWNTTEWMEQLLQATERHIEGTRDNWVLVYRQLGLEKEKRYERDGTRHDEIPLFALIEQYCPEVLAFIPGQEDQADRV